MSRPSAAVKEWGGAFALVALAVGVPLAVAYASGAMDTPYADDWAYSRVVFHLHETGDLQFIGWGPMTLVGHLLWGVPFIAIFGSSLEALHWATAVAAAIGLLASFAVLRRFLSPPWALVGTALVALQPAFGILATTYMTDITGFAAAMICLALGLASLDAEGRGRWALLAASLALGFFGFTVRNIMIAAPLAVLIGHLVVARRRGASIVHLVWPPVLLYACMRAFMKWRHGIPGQRTPDEVTGPNLRALRIVAQVYFTLALAALPALMARVVMSRGADLRRRHLAVAAGVIATASLLVLVVLPAAVTDDPIEVPLGDYFGRSWRASHNVSLAETKPAFLPAGVWAAIDVMALLAGLLLALSLFRAARAALERPRRQLDLDLVVLALFGLLYAGALVVAAVGTGAPLVERHLLPLVVPVVVLALRGAEKLREPRTAFVPALAMALLATLTVVTVVHETATRGAEWDVAEQAVARGVPARKIDAGFAWVGYHQPGPVRIGLPQRGWSEPLPAYSRTFPRAGNCLSTSYIHLSATGLTLVRTHEFRWVPGLGRLTIWLYRDPEACAAEPLSQRRRERGCDGTAGAPLAPRRRAPRARGAPSDPGCGAARRDRRSP